MSATEHVIGSTTAFIDPGVYQRLDCGCILYAVEIDPCGPRLCLVENDADNCDLTHTTDDFMPRRWPR